MGGILGGNSLREEVVAGGVGRTRNLCVYGKKGKAGFNLLKGRES
ncbi:MAG: hypothetical protein H6Q82_1348 [Deltaproteobacteria bacterium]|nr:hypothetical protein [Deltaproteobacteria bacterium]